MGMVIMGYPTCVSWFSMGFVGKKWREGHRGEGGGGRDEKGNVGAHWGNWS